MSIFNPFRSRDTDLDEEIAVWSVEHGTDFHDFSPAQIERRRLYIRATNQGLDANRVAYVQYLVKHDRVSDAPSPALPTLEVRRP